MQRHRKSKGCVLFGRLNSLWELKCTFYFNAVLRPKFQVSLLSTGFLERNSPCFFHFSLILSFGGAERLHTIRAFLQMRSIDSTAVDSGILTETIKRRRRRFGYCLPSWQSSRSWIFIILFRNQALPAFFL